MDQDIQAAITHLELVSKFCCLPEPKRRNEAGPTLLAVFLRLSF